jgi:hypothetical protein
LPTPRIKGLDQATFSAGGLNYDATVRNLEWIGEAATHIPEAIFQRCWKSLTPSSPACAKAAENWKSQSPRNGDPLAETRVK